jgi:hypothetical protein
LRSTAAISDAPQMRQVTGANARKLFHVDS